MKIKVAKGIIRRLTKNVEKLTNESELFKENLQLIDEISLLTANNKKLLAKNIDYIEYFFRVQNKIEETEKLNQDAMLSVMLLLQNVIKNNNKGLFGKGKLIKEVENVISIYK